MKKPETLIKQVEIFRAPFRLKKPFVISLGKMVVAENIYVRIKTSNGLTGFGECSPFATINGETMDTCLIVGQKLARELLGKNPLDIPGCSNLMDRCIYGNTGIKSAINIALYDIAAQCAGVPLYAFIGGSNNKTVVTDYTVSIDTPGKMADEACEIVSDGFKIIKVKVGKSGKDDVERIRRIRNAIGMDIILRIDANQGWNKKEAIETLKKLAQFNVQFCEEPVPRWMFMDLPEISRLSEIKIMADESCFDHHDAERLISLAACRYFNIKLGKSSGITNALEIIRLAEPAGIGVQVGGFIESRLGFTASSHLALKSDCIAFFDFDTPLMLEDDPVEGGIQYSKGGNVKIPDTPGLGATVDEDFLKLNDKITVK
jgi:L-alanine-DL-glutamate epimerase-like enolase superfamily enzyme